MSYLEKHEPDALLDAPDSISSDLGVHRQRLVRLHLAENIAETAELLIGKETLALLLSVLAHERARVAARAELPQLGEVERLAPISSTRFVRYGMSRSS